MKNLKPFAILLALVLVLSMATTAFAQDEEDTGYVGTIEILEGEDGESGDIVFTSEDGETVFIIAPSGSFNPSALADFEEGTLFEIEGVILNEGDDDNPGTIQVTVFGEFDAETDTDEDGIVDLSDNCPDIANETQDDADADGIGDVCDEFDVENDSDNDGVADDVDNCPDVANPIEDETVGQTFPVDTDDDGEGDACEEVVVEEDGEEDGEGGFYCRNRDIEHPNGARIAEAYEADYAELIADFCGDEDGRRGWGVIRNELRADSGETRGNGNGNGNSNGNNGNGNGNGNGGGGNGNGNGNGNGGGGNGNGNGNGRGN